MFGRFREIVDWRFVLSAAFLILVVQLGFNSWSDSQHNDRLVRQLEQVHKTAAKERKQASEERAVLVEGQRRLRRDYQLLLDYLESIGVAVPPNLSRAITLGGSGDDDDGDRTTITVRPDDDNDNDSSTSAPSTPSPTPSQGGSSDDPDVVEDLTGEVGDTVEDTRRLTEDTIKDLTDNLDAIVDP